jgi:putative heme-binding domain-containing protein
VRGLSFFPALDSTKAVLAVLEKPTDSWIDYTLEHTLAALEPAWSASFHDGTLTAGNEAAKKAIEAYINRRSPSMIALRHIQTLVNPDISERDRGKAYKSLEKLKGDPNNGLRIYGRVCASCHKIGSSGFAFGPDLDDVGRRLTRHEIVESIIEPTKKVDPKYVTTTIITTDGKLFTGFIVEKSKESITLLLAGGKKETIAQTDIDEMAETKQSSMPENLASTLAPAEFLDVVEFMCERK